MLEVKKQPNPKLRNHYYPVRPDDLPEALRSKFVVSWNSTRQQCANSALVSKGTQETRKTTPVKNDTRAGAKNDTREHVSGVKKAPLLIEAKSEVLDATKRETRSSKGFSGSLTEIGNAGQRRPRTRCANGMCGKSLPIDDSCRHMSRSGACCSDDCRQFEDNPETRE
jgi:hypothetical protein